jgi:hypothetical protein
VIETHDHRAISKSGKASRSAEQRGHDTIGDRNFANIASLERSQEPSLDSRLRVREFLKTRIIPQRIEHRIEPEQRRSQRHVLSQGAIIRYGEQFL